MKNERLLKILGFTMLAVIILTWLIPSSSFDGYNVTRGNIKPIGLWDLFNSFGITVAYFWQIGIFVLFVGGFYGVLNKAGALKVLVDSIKKCFKGKEKWFLIISIVFFMITSSLTGIYFPLFAFVPLFIAVMLSMGYPKLLALLCTVGAIIIGNMSVLYNTLIFQILYLKGFSYLWYRLALLALSLTLIIIYVWKTASNKKGNIKMDDGMFFLEAGVNEKKNKIKWPVITAFILLFVLVVLGCTPWYNMFETKIFNNMYEAVMNVSIGNFPIFKNILGQAVLPFGEWGIVELYTVLGVIALFIAAAYKLTFIQTARGFVRGINKLLPTAIIVIFINVVVVFTLNSGFYITVMQFLITLTENINITSVTLSTLFTSTLVIDNYYFANHIMDISYSLVGNREAMPLLALIGQTMYGTAMLIAPTSLLLLAGLNYVDVSYKDWLKYIWRILLILLIIIFIILIIVSLIEKVV